MSMLSQSCSLQADRVAVLIRSQLTAHNSQWANLNPHLSELQAFYKQRDYHPVWVDERGPLPHAQQLLNLLMNAGEEGLDPSCYDIPVLQQLWPVKMGAGLAQLEIRLSHAFMKYSDDVRNGQLQPEAKDRYWRAYSGRVPALKLLKELLAKDELAAALHDLPPPQLGYEYLRKALRHYNYFAKQGGWSDIPAGQVLQLGQRHPQVKLVRERLMVDDLELEPVARESVALFDRTLHDAVLRFQARYGLEATGKVDKATRQAMNVTVTERIQQIKVNMDRWRWLPRDLGYDYIMVNTAAYQLTAYVDRQPHMRMRVITGKPERPSPIVDSKLVQVILNPDWIVPITIAVEDIIPRIKTEPDYLARHNIRIFTSHKAGAEEIAPTLIDWETISMDPFPYTLIQEPGVGNSLGQIKFVFLNDFAVFLHDTPIRDLFAQNKRAFSSGCIRVEKPRELAKFLLGEGSGWGDDELEQSIRSGETEKIQMDRNIPIYLVYWTAWVDEDRVVHFRDDIYNWDKVQGKCT